LFDLYKRAARNNPGNKQEIVELNNIDSHSDRYKQIVKSQTYIGYKILWVIRLFLAGKKFPSGNIRGTKWRTYIHDIMQFISNEEILKTLLNIDSEAFFQIISVLFIDGRPCELVK